MRESQDPASLGEARIWRAIRTGWRPTRRSKARSGLIRLSVMRAGVTSPLQPAHLDARHPQDRRAHHGDVIPYRVAHSTGAEQGDVVDWLGWAGLVATAVVVPVVGFWLALRQDKLRWAREKRAELYIDLLAEAYAEKEWMLGELHRRELAEIGPIQDDNRFPALPDTRMEPRARALLGSRMAAFSSPGVRGAFNELSRSFPLLPVMGSSPAARLGVEKAFSDFEVLIRRELGSA